MSARQNPRVFEPSLCDLEPIHSPGAIQPHGALLVALADGSRITHASANLELILGRSAESVLGWPLAEVVGADACDSLRANGDPHDGTALGQLEITGFEGRALHLQAHTSGRHICVDIEPVCSAPVGRTPAVLAHEVLRTFAQAATQTELCERAARGLRRISEYDRVLVYRFDESGDGEVIAEDRSPDVEPYLGLHYPAADIPPQARYLYLRQQVGAIADVNYRPVQLLADAMRVDGTQLDLSESALRSISPLHIEYMRNMGVVASLRIRLMLGQRLWGLLVCHHRSPLVASAGLRAAAGTIGTVVSLLLASLAETEVNAQRLRGMAGLSRLINRLAAPMPLPEVLQSVADDLVHLMDAAGAIVQLSGTHLFFGCTPPPALAERALAVLLAEAAGNVLAVDDLGLRHPELAGCASAGSGALLLPLTLNAGDAILWFRPEQARTVAWGGDPGQHVITDPLTGRISPRVSFAAWQQKVRGRSRPWPEAALLLARNIGQAVDGELARRAKNELALLRNYDALTGLPNRNLLRQHLMIAARESGTAAVILFVDVDGTKAVNDTMGIAGGDALIKEVGQRLLAVAGAANLTVRLAGQEFIVLCSDRGTAAVAELSARIHEAIAAPFEIGGRWFQPSASVRRAIAEPSQGRDLVAAVDRAIDAAKIDIGTREAAEAQRQKMEALGRMMGGVAHEINNMLQPIALLGHIMLKNALVRGEGEQHLGVMLDCSKKARQIIGDLLAFSRPTARSTEVLDSVTLLQDSLRLVSQAVPPGIAIETRIQGCPPPVRLNRTTFAQVLLNLTTNAAAAMAGQGGLTIALEQEGDGPGEITARPARRFARLRVTDTGCGMTKATMDRAFEPFFSTKPVGEGTGLGLSVVYGLVQEMGGTISLASEPGRGTTVTVLIPGDLGGN